MSEATNTAQHATGTAVEGSQTSASSNSATSGIEQSDPTSSQQVSGSTSEQDVAEDDEDENDGPEEENVVKIPGGGLAGLQARKEAERANAQTEQRPGGRQGNYTLPYQNVRTAER
ncbi:hypothetical protein A4X09_0g4097 [Tilletia walkeri]|uniref:Uncharacterized protein n=1 Tax=Tilletia walkeri TaxID=117179 RepID=A0A8X7N8E4_9BASI|nr:hypothetical protein A4X09_0g4097 [Tilletia walkeri]